MAEMVARSGDRSMVTGREHESRKRDRAGERCGANESKRDVRGQ